MARVKLAGSEQVIEIHDDYFDKLTEQSGGKFTGEASVFGAKDGMVLMFASKLENGMFQIVRYGVSMEDLKKHAALYALWQHRDDYPLDVEGLQAWLSDRLSQGTQPS